MQLHNKSFGFSMLWWFLGVAILAIVLLAISRKQGNVDFQLNNKDKDKKMRVSDLKSHERREEILEVADLLKFLASSLRNMVIYFEMDDIRGARDSLREAEKIKAKLKRSEWWKNWW